MPPLASTHLVDLALPTSPLKIIKIIKKIKTAHAGLPVLVTRMDFGMRGIGARFATISGDDFIK